MTTTDEIHDIQARLLACHDKIIASQKREIECYQRQIADLELMVVLTAQLYFAIGVMQGANLR